MLTGISLFSGAVDGLGIAFQNAGIEVTHHLEIDQWCCDVLHRNFPHSAVIQKDVKHVTAADFGTRPIDVVFGSPPCQGFSAAGDKRGFADERYLWPEMCRLVQQIQPRVVLVENVRGSVSGDGDNLADAVLSDLEREGYTGAAYLVSANLFGAPHERYRVFIVAYAERQRHAPAAAQQEYPHHEEWDTAPHQQAGNAVPNANFASRDPLGYPRRQRTPRERRFRNESAPSRLVKTQSQRTDYRGGWRYLHESQLGRAADGTAKRLDAVADFPGWPAGQGRFQYEYEPQRTIKKKTLDFDARVQALGNAVVWQQAYPFALAIAEWLKQYE
jgi:DNA (cytosine-5)-methyltransferase 1